MSSSRSRWCSGTTWGDGWMQACGLTAAMESSRPGIYGMRIYGKPSRRDKFYLLMGLLICSCSLWGNSAGFSCSFPCLCDSHDNDRALLCCVVFMTFSPCAILVAITGRLWWVVCVECFNYLCSHEIFRCVYIVYVVWSICWLPIYKYNTAVMFIQYKHNCFLLERLFRGEDKEWLRTCA